MVAGRWLRESCKTSNGARSHAMLANADEPCAVNLYHASPSAMESGL